MSEANSYLAQGGISAKRVNEDIDDYIEDTLRAGHYENDPEVVRDIFSFDKFDTIFIAFDEVTHTSASLFTSALVFI